MAIPPQFLKKSAPAGPAAGPAKKGSLPPWLQKGGAPASGGLPDAKKKARKKAISDMQSKDMALDAKLGANDLPDKMMGK